MNPFRVAAFVALALVISACGGDAATNGAPQIAAFAAEPATVSVGGTSMLTWEVQGNPTLLQISTEDFYSPIDVTGETSYEARPTETTTYVLTARNAAGTDQKDVIVGVEAVDPAE